MGCNYYLRRNYCPCCGQHREEVHIGKQSAGWRFLAHIKEITTFEKYTEFLKTGTIYDEYGRMYSVEDFLEKIYTYKNAKVQSIDSNNGIWDECDWSLNDFC